MFRTIHNFRRVSMAAKNMGDMPFSEVRMLKLIKWGNANDEGVIISTLSEKLEVSKPAVSQMINTLEDKGYVERITTKNDRRNVYVRLTQAGEQNLERAIKSGLLILTQVFDEMGEKDTNTLLDLMDRFSSIVSSYTNK